MARGDSDLPALGTFIRQQRGQLDLTQAQLAEKLGWSQERISLLETGKYGMPSVPALVRLAEVLDVSVMEMVEVLGYPLISGGPNGATPGSAEGHAALQYTLQRLLSIRASTLKEALSEASDQIAVAMAADKIDAFVYDAPTNSLIAIGTSNTPMGQLQHESGLGRVPIVNRDRTAQVYETGQVFCTGDAQNDPHIAVGVKETLGVQSFLAVPLRVGSGIHGVLAAESAQPNRFSSEEQHFFEAAANWVGMIADRSLVVEALRETAAEEARREAADEVITMLAHDLGNLLTPLKGRLDILGRRLTAPGNEREVEHAREASRSVEGMQRLVSRLLDVSRLDHGLFTLELQPIDLSHLVEEVAEELRPSWPELVVRVADVPEVLGDPVRLQEVLVNLVTNAIQHSPEGATITLGAGREHRDSGDFVVVNVTDEGPGIASDLVPQLFERFRGSGGIGSMGLGLYLSRRLVEAHGGSLTVETAVGQGTTFWMSIPAART